MWTGERNGKERKEKKRKERKEDKQTKKCLNSGKQVSGPITCEETGESRHGRLGIDRYVPS